MLAKALKRYLLVGDRIPNLTLQIVYQDKVYSMPMADIFSNKRNLIIGHPGAFTHFSTYEQLPEYQNYLSKFKALGIENIFSLSINDHFVLKKYSEKYNIGIPMISDFKGDFVKNLDLALSEEEFFTATCRRTAIIIDDMVILGVSAEDDVQYTSKTKPETIEKMLIDIYEQPELAKKPI
ncbi:unnamed protein product [Blepharisma stoltei]|uniref:Thioredoxin domain-containing protein n=1 Tax=Blepharisma stoltei TaxID=1481888 RepID=A0AAU9K817_9CILI|nr:unnamed protein product [Blepharisma stoltei]